MAFMPRAWNNWISPLANVIRVGQPLPDFGSSSTSSPVQIMGHCITGDTLLPIRRRKRRRFDGSNEELEYDDLLVPIRDILPGDEVLSLNEDTDTFEYHPVKGLLDMGVQEVFELRTKSGRVIRTTAEHPYLAKIIDSRSEILSKS